VEKIVNDVDAMLESKPAQLSAVAELQGLYGPFTFPEKLLQKIWLRGDFDRRKLVLNDGRRLTIRHAGRWNLLGGPDFKDARVKFDDSPEIVGDVELHLRASDWHAHGHARDAAYDNVILHVVLFPVAPHAVTVGACGKAIPIISLLPLLHHDLEEYAEDEAVETLADRPAAKIVEMLGPMPQEQLAALILRCAKARWTQKVHFARLRIQRLGWNEACHQTALEILGYRFNRATMLRVASAHPLGTWSGVAPKVDALFDEQRGAWSLQGLRPANHPRKRLVQYATWVSARPDWPVQLEALSARLPQISGSELTGDVRRTHEFTTIRAEWSDGICKDAISGTRFENLMCDGFLPLSAAKTGTDLFQTWYHWFTGDIPPLLPRALRELQIFGGRDRPACHGSAQGLLGWLIESERTAAGSPGRGA
jgi:hypothetical protein